ncbi:acyltransferase family protein [Clostridium sp. DJ247]|uniref:acyltransferase family protein n=1 Tax=Clostridium sp. DJ247 TaxID=2726188 RepID=UPI001626559C|nr:acyltransferase family protein [Clostridium sp. DJ247]MBC2580247.1 acyltransferase family protein [Clostridium sp. DJ247]
MKKYYKDMDIARGIGIFLVVLGHSFPDDKFNNSFVYEYLYKFIYSFHMPLFFIISGFFAYKIYNISSLSKYKEFISGKFKRLIIPYFAVSLIAIPIKLYMNRYAARPILIDNLIIDLILYPTGNGTINHTGTPIQYFWFIYTLFFIFAVAPLLNKIPIRIVLLITAILNLIHFKQVSLFYAWGIVHYLFYFYLGIYFNSIYKKYVEFKYKKLLIATSFIVLVLINLKNVSAQFYPLYSLTTALIGSLLFINVSYLIVNNKIGEKLKFIGNYSYDIYLFSWFFQTGVRVILFQMLKLNYTFVTIMMLIAGLLPIILSNLILKKIPILDKVLLGNTRI